MPTFEAKNFFNVYLSERSFQRMLIPATAVVCSNELMPATATLRNCKGRCWYVEVNKCDDNMYFEKGWRRFIDENSIKDSDFLVFSYVGWSVFDVKVLGLDGCEKSVSHVLLEEQEVEIVLVEEGERWEEQEQKEDDDNNFLEEGEDCELDEEEEEANDDDDYQEEKDSRQELEEENMMMTVKKERSIKEIEDGMRDLLLCTKICPRFESLFCGEDKAMEEERIGQGGSYLS